MLTGEGLTRSLPGYDIFLRRRGLRRFCAASRARSLRPQLFLRLYPYLRGCRAICGISRGLLGAVCRRFPGGSACFSHGPAPARDVRRRSLFLLGLDLARAEFRRLRRRREDGSLPAVGFFARWHLLHQGAITWKSQLFFCLATFLSSQELIAWAMANGVEGRVPPFSTIAWSSRRRPPRVSSKLKGPLPRRSPFCARRLGDLLPHDIARAHQASPLAPPTAPAFAGAHGRKACVTEALLAGSACREPACSSRSPSAITRRESCARGGGERSFFANNCPPSSASYSTLPGIARPFISGGAGLLNWAAA